MTLILIVDDVHALAEQYAYDLKRLAGHDTLHAPDGAAALEILAREPVDCLLLDLEMPGMDGFEVLRQLERRGEGQRVPVIVYTGTGDYDRCAQAIRLGAVSFIDKAEPMERVVQEIAGVLERRRLTAQVAALQREMGEAPLAGSSPVMRKLREAIARVAPIPSPVLIVGESGSGKEVVAREVHRQSGAKGPFVAINSAALPHDLVESELFGHERGAFTGAVTLHKGAFEAAIGGTLFLDEIGELPAAAQAKLLRVLEQRQVTRLGGTRTIAVDARVVAATNRDLEAEIAAARFRQDLYYRLNVHVLAVPPLRDRLSDIPELAQHLLTEMCARFRARPRTLSGAALEGLMAYDWSKNNVRELRNTLERMLISTDREVLGEDDLPPDIAEQGPVRDGGAEPRTFQELKAVAERRIVVAALEKHDWHITRTADALGLADHASLLKIMRRHGITRE